MNTALAAAFGATAAMFYAMHRLGKPDPGMMANGMLAGLVAITAPCAFVQPWAAAVIGIIAGVIVIESILFIERQGIDDPVGAISVHGVGGIFGVLCVGIFSSGDYGAGWNLTTKGDGGERHRRHRHPVRLRPRASPARRRRRSARSTIIIVMGGIVYGFFKIQNALMKGGIRLRAEEDEQVGLDLPEMGVLAYDNLVLNEIDVVGPEGDKVLARGGPSPDPSIGR